MLLSCLAVFLAAIRHSFGKSRVPGLTALLLVALEALYLDLKEATRRTFRTCVPLMAQHLILSTLELKWEPYSMFPTCYLAGYILPTRVGQVPQPTASGTAFAEA